MMIASSMSRMARRRISLCGSSSVLRSHTYHISASRPLPPGLRQRRFSSSKPSSPPNDDSRPITAPADAHVEETARSPSPSLKRRAATRLSRQKVKDSLPKPTQTIAGNGLSQLPSVPSTHHLHPHEIHMASFFSLHRPISITAIIPPPSSPSTFSSLFIPRVVQNPHPTEVIYTLSVAVNSLEKAATQSEDQQVSSQKFSSRSLQPNQPLTRDTLRAAITQASTTNAEPANMDSQAPQSSYINLEELARNFRPFRPPPAPEPMTFTAETDHQYLHPQPIRMSRIRFTARLPLHRDPKYPTRPQYVEPRNSGRQPFLERMRKRHERWEEGRAERRREIWKAISVKRQRKLKMKKHKYKKLMRRTRNLRRRLDRL